jgi:S1-C subfamily serine protease
MAGGHPISNSPFLRPAYALILLLALGAASPSQGQGQGLGPVAVERIAKELASRRFGATPESTRGLRDVFSASVLSVPLIITETGLGSGVVIGVNTTSSAGLIVTNHHVIASAFRDKESNPFAVLLFYEPRLADEKFDASRIAGCLTSRPSSSWCQIFLGVARVGYVFASDPGRDLALLVVSQLPAGIRAVPSASPNEVRPGDEVSVIGHPVGLVWSLTTGIVSAVRSSYRIGASPDAPAIAVVQTQTPIHPGNSGGPLLTTTGRLAGVVVGSQQLPARLGSGTESGGAAAGLNFAIAVSEVSVFLTKHGLNTP